MEFFNALIGTGLHRSEHNPVGAFEFMKQVSTNYRLEYFIYCRKSSESEDKQVLSLPAQKSELLRYATDNKLTIVDVYEESASAHVIDRKKFNEMLGRIQKGEARGLVVWDESRIARNSFDGGKVIYMIDLGQIAEIRKPGKIYSNTPDDKSWLAMCFMMSKKESDDKGVNVRRGLREKAQQGMYVGSAKAGYRFDPLAPQGEKDLIPVSGTHEIIGKCWKTMLSGKYTVVQLLELLNNEWGYRSVRHGRLGGKPMCLSELYEVLHDRFYMGEFEYPQGSDIWHKWRGVPLVSEEEFNRVQILIGNKFKPRSHHRTFAYTGLVKCICGSQITAEEKWQVICSLCKQKFSSLNRTSCPNCDLEITEMNNPSILHYIYYHCSRKKDKNCRQPAIRVEDLEPQIDQALSSIEINPEFKEWAIKYLNELNDSEVDDRNVVISSLQQAYDDCVKRLDNLVKLKISTSNSDGSLLSDDEFRNQKESILEEKRKLEINMGNTGQRIEQWVEAAETAFDFAIHARYKFATGTLGDKREILSTIGSNLVLEGKKLRLDLQKPYYFFKEVVFVEPTTSREFEPDNRTVVKAQLEASWAKNPFMQGRIESNYHRGFWRLASYH